VSRQVSSSQTLLQSLLVGGQERLQTLLLAASRVQLPTRCLSDGESASSDEGVVEALLEQCLDLILQWISRRERDSSAYSTPFCRLLNGSFVYSSSAILGFPGLRLCFLLP
jgi:hypothetical protein